MSKETITHNPGGGYTITKDGDSKTYTDKGEHIGSSHTVDRVPVPFIRDVVGGQYEVVTTADSHVIGTRDK